MDLIPSQGGVAVCFDPHSCHGVVKDFIVLDKTQPWNTFEVYYERQEEVWRRGKMGDKTVAKTQEIVFLFSPEL